MRLHGTLFLAALAVLLEASPATAEPPLAAAEAAERSGEHTWILGVGGAAEVELGDGSFHPGANLMFEWDAVEDWLELEVGASVLAASGGVEVPIDLLVKRPFRLARWAEVMVGLGPEVVYVAAGAFHATYIGAEAAVDFMFWPWGRRVGLWVEPAYDALLHDGVVSGAGGTGGLLVGW